MDDVTSPLAIKVFDGTVTVSFSDAIIASTTRAKVLSEPGYEAVYYVPFEDIYFDLLRPSATVTRCRWKGDATYWNVSAVGEGATDIMWAYEIPLAGAAAIAGHGAFDPKRVRIEATPAEDRLHTPHIVE